MTAVFAAANLDWLIQDPRATINVTMLTLLSPWWLGAAAACVIGLILSRRRGHLLRRFEIALTATIGWMFAIVAGMVGLSLAAGWAITTSPRYEKVGHARRQQVFITTTTGVLAVQMGLWGWAVGAAWFALVTPAAAAVAVGALAGYRYVTRPALDPTRSFSAADKDRRLDAQGGVCNYADEGCPCSVARGDLFEGDHIIPWAKGGRTVPENLQMLCHTCNHLKTDLDDSDARVKIRAHWQTHGGTGGTSRSRFRVFGGTSRRGNVAAPTVERDEPVTVGGRY